MDGNVCRVLSRLTGVANHIKAGVFKDDLGWVMAEKILVARAPDDCASKNVYGSPGEVRSLVAEVYMSVIIWKLPLIYFICFHIRSIKP